MSKSQIKRLHQQQELEKAANLEEENEGDAPVQRKGPANRFAFFDDEDEGGEDGNQSDELEDRGASAPAQKSNRKKEKKNKKKGKKVTANEESEETEIQMLTRLAALNAKELKNVTSDAPSLEELMKVDMKQFDMSAEIKRKLGKAFKDVTLPGEPTEPRWPPGKRATGRIVKNKPTWFPDRDYGLSMVQSKVEKNGITWFTLRHNNAYEQRERMYWMGEKSHNVGVVQEIFSDTPYHLNSLIMMANASRMNEDLNTGADLIERGIWYVDQHAAATFEPFNWRHRMDYRDYENRAFYLCLNRHMLNAANKRCFETALNTAKLIFKLDPNGDALAIMSIIDTYALRAKQYSWVVNVFEAAKKFKKLHLLPNWPFSVALAKFFLANTDEEKDAAQQELCIAIRHFPSVVVAIMELLHVQADSAVSNCKIFTVAKAESECDNLKLLTKIYTKQTEEIWKDTNVLLLLEQATRAVAVSDDKKDTEECEEWKERRFKMYSPPCPNIKRLAELLEVLPAVSISDPEPPKNGRCGYPKTVSNQDRQYADDSFIGGFIHSLLPQFTGENSFQEQLNRYGEVFLNYLIGYFQAPDTGEDVAAGWFAHRDALNARNAAEVIPLEGQEPVELPRGGGEAQEDSDDDE